MKKNDTRRFFQVLLSGVSQWSVIGFIFLTFGLKSLNYTILLMTILFHGLQSTQKLIKSLTFEPVKSYESFKKNTMIVPSHYYCWKKATKFPHLCKMKWYKHQVWKYRETSGMGKDDKLNSDKPVTQLCKKCAG